MSSTIACFIILVLLGMLPASEAFASLIVSAPVDVIGNLPLSEFTGSGYGTRAYKDWGNEPSVAVDPSNPNNIVISSFSFGTLSSGRGANIFYSTTDGSSWTSQFSVPAPAAGIGIPNDWRFLYDDSGVLHAGVLGGCDACNVFHGTTTDPTSLAAWTWTGSGAQINTPASSGRADQPWIALHGSNVFVAYDDFHTATGERVAVSSNAGGTFTVDNSINNGPQANSVNPGTRIATDRNGTIYSIFGVGRSTAVRGVHNVTYYLNRSRNGGVTWDFNGASAVGGIVIDSGVSTQLCNACTQASNNWFAGVNDLRGNVTAIAADGSGSHVYVLIGKQNTSGTNRIYLVEFHPVGANLVASPEIVVSPAGEQAALPAMAVKDDGTVVIMYETYASDNEVRIHVASSEDFGASIASDIVEYAFTPLTLLQATGITTSNREFGDYVFMMSVGNTVYAAFAGLGDVNSGGINTTGLIDPFFFTATDIPHPASWLLLLTGLACVGWLRLRTRLQWFRRDPNWSPIGHQPTEMPRTTKTCALNDYSGSRAADIYDMSMQLKVGPEPRGHTRAK